MLPVTARTLGSRRILQRLGVINTNVKQLASEPPKMTRNACKRKVNDAVNATRRKDARRQMQQPENEYRFTL